MSGLWICDVNGVLVDTCRITRAAFVATAAHFGCPFTDRHFQEVKSLGLVEAYRVLDPDGDPLVRREYHLARVRERLSDVRAYPGVRRTFALAKANHITIAATTSYGAIAEACLVSTGLYQYVDCLVTAEEVKRPKPHPDAILRVMQLLCVDAGDVDSGSVICVGDTPADIHAGKNAGVRTVGVTYGVSADAEIRMAEPDRVIRAFDEMWSFLPAIQYRRAG